MPKKIIYAFLLSVLTYMLTMQNGSAFLWLLKVLPILALIIAVLQAPTSDIKPYLLAALIFSGCGDVLLAIDSFVYGLTAFLVAQIIYAFVFSRFWKSIKTRRLLYFCMLAYSMVVVCLLLPHLGTLKLPVIAYLCVISIMGILAIQSSLPLRWAVIGALFFIASDSLIAINKFVSPLPLEGVLIMGTYYAAQYMLVLGFLKHSNNQAI
jgi:uncharacterized membrane protein YhhN